LKDAQDIPTRCAQIEIHRERIVLRRAVHGIRMA